MTDHPVIRIARQFWWQIPAAALLGWGAGHAVYDTGMSSFAFLLLLWFIAPPLIALVERRHPFLVCLTFFAAVLTANQVRQFAFYREHGFDIDRELDRHWPMWVIDLGVSLCACAWGSLCAWTLNRARAGRPQ